MENITGPSDSAAAVETPTPDDNEEEEIHTLETFKKKYHCGHTKTYEELNAGRLKGKKNGASTLITNAREWYRNLPDYKPAA